VVFSLPHPLEMTVAEKLVQMIPCADMVRFGKNGSDATSGAVRLARAHTRRDHVLVCGYHGWQDWYIGSTSRSLGVPQSVRDLTHTFPYNDLPALDALFRAHREQVAAVILEPMNVTEPAPGYLAGVREIAHRHGALLVFDETITGFRFDRGGAQRYFGVTPDLATFGKGIANGYPLSALVGRADVMRLMEEIFFSSTFGGETASLAASLATLEKLEREPILESMHATGRELQEGARKLIDRHELGAVLGISGHPSWSFLLIKDAADYSQWHIRTFVLQEMFARGILMIGSHNMSYAHSRDDLAKLFAAYDEVFGELRDALGRRDLEERLKCESLKPLFRVR
jgi:glutamate-1-semialdehyde 2,1-aminomutase